MTKQIEKRLQDLEREANTYEEIQVIVDWDPDPKPPKDDNVRVIEWGEDDEIIKKKT